MFSVLIVDDEEPVLDSYEFMLNSFSEGDLSKTQEKVFSVAGKARTGYEALKLIHELEPNIVFMDINIPGIDGLAVLEDVYKKFPHMICILSTAYERFDLARRAIPLGVFAYLVKPVSKKTFFTTLENALSQLRSQAPEISEYPAPQMALLRRDVWAPMDEQCWSWYRDKLSLPSDHGIVIIAEMESEPIKCKNLISEQLSLKHHCICDIMENRALFLISEDCNPVTFRQKTEKLLEEIPGTVARRFGIGGLYRGPPSKSQPAPASCYIVKISGSPSVIRIVFS
jgi:two-component system response regulator YesN